MEISQSSDEPEQLRTRLRKMTDAQLMSFGKAARSLCRHRDYPETFKRQLAERVRSGGAGIQRRSDMCARRKPEEGGFPCLPHPCLVIFLTSLMVSTTRADRKFCVVSPL
jgi:hypothetical protein